MSALFDLTGNEKRHLTWSVTDAINFLIENDERIKNVADHFSNGDYASAFRDIMEKGLNEMETMCDMDDRLNETETQMQNRANRIVTTLSTPRW